VHDAKRSLARQLGVEEALDGRRTDLAEAIAKITKGHGVAASFDFVGTDATLALAVQATCAGGKVSQIGLAGGSAKLKPLATSRFEVLYEATLWGTIKELREVVALAESGRLTPIAAETAPLKDINRVYRRLKAGEVQGRAVITPNDGRTMTADETRSRR
jgi:alcohol dehydrogenase, propanol-preferring